MNRYIFLRRIQGPAILLTFGVLALLDQWDILSFGRSWPLYLIVFGVLQLAQRAALAAAEPPPAYSGYPGSYTGYPAAASPAGYAGAPGAPAAGSAIVPAENAGSINEFGEKR